MANKYTDAVHKVMLPARFGRNRLAMKAILTAMAWHTDNKSGTFWGSHNKFAYEANCSRQAVKENVPKLVELGLVSIIGERATRNGPCHVFKMNYETILKFTDQGVELPGSSATGLLDSDNQVAERRHQVAERPDQVAGHPKNSSLNSSSTRLMNSSSQEDSFADNFVETRENPGPPDANDLAHLVEEDSVPSLSTPAPQAHKVPVRAAASVYVPRPVYTDALKNHQWPADDLCKDGSPMGLARCLTCGVKAAEVRRTGVTCLALPKSKVFEVED